jgi:beta-glucanase (GH16 family)
MRARLPRGKGLWPAFWLLPKDQSWPPEIDVMEEIGDPGVVYHTVHSRIADQPGVKAEVPGDPDGFHTFAVAWDPQQVVWYVDGRETARKPTPPDANKPMYLLVNLAVGGHWPGVPDASTAFPARMTVRWVRAYRFVP